MGYAQWRLESGAPNQLRDSGSCGSPGEPLLQQIWRRQRLRRDRLRTLDGIPVVVLHPGIWNREAGPDFRGAVFQLGRNPAQCGDVEVDVHPEGWRDHRHLGNPDYRDVGLHVVWDARGKAPWKTPVIELKGQLDAPLEELHHWHSGLPESVAATESPGRCAGPLRSLPDGLLARLVREAATVRLMGKASRLAARARAGGWEQAFWEELFGALGYKRNVWPMRRLGELRRALLPADGSGPPEVQRLQARLLGVAGLLPADVNRHPVAAREYLRRLWDAWWRERGTYAEHILPACVWRLHGLRPANHPQRRLALAAHWLREPGWTRRIEEWRRAEIPDRRLPSSLADVLATDPDPFWSHHRTFRSSRTARAAPLLGAARVTDIAMNVVLPWLWSRADVGSAEAERTRIECRYFAWPAAQDNALLRLARQRLWAGDRPRWPHTAAVQQGVMQIVRDFCDRSNALCEGCRFPALVARLAKPWPADGDARRVAGTGW